MLIPSTAVKTASVERLTRAWAKLYLPDFRSLPLKEQPVLLAELFKASSVAGRTRTIAKLNEQLIQFQSEVASVQTSALYAYMKNVMHLREVKQLAEASFQIYKQLVEFYRQDQLRLSAIVWQIQTDRIEDLVHVPAIESLAEALEPLLLEFQRQHQRSQDWRNLGFLTTQFNFCNQWLTRKLTPSERCLTQPYLKFVEEQMSHPWQRVCAAAVGHSVGSPALAIVEKLMPLAQDIAETTYGQLLERCPEHHSRRGALSSPEVGHSCLRDLKMFQAYLWLCLLEGDLATVEQELLELCVQVMPSIGVKWELTAIWTETLKETLMLYLEPAQQQQVLPYIERMHQIFWNARPQFDTPLSRSIEK